MSLVIVLTNKDYGQEFLKTLEGACKLAWMSMNFHPDAGGELKAEDVGGFQVLSSLLKYSSLKARPHSVNLLFFYVDRGEDFGLYLGAAVSEKVSRILDRDNANLPHNVTVSAIPTDSARWFADPVWSIFKATS